MRRVVTPRTVLAVVLAVAGLLGIGCGKKAAKKTPDDAALAGPAKSSEAPAQIVLRNLEMRIEDGVRPVELHTEELTELLARQLFKSEVFFAAEDQAAPHLPQKKADLQLVVSHDLIDNDGEPQGLAAVEARVVWIDGAHEVVLSDRVLGANSIDSNKLSAVERDRMIAALVAQTVAEVGRSLIAMEKLRRADGATLLTALSGDNPRTVQFALERIGEAKPAGAVKAVAPLLKASDADVRGAAVTALVALGDRSAVHHLTRSAEVSDYDATQVVIESVAVLGGPEAVEYLEFVATGHPDDSVKKHAADALRRLRARSKSETKN